MKIAICFSGGIRTGVMAADNILRFIGDLRPYCDFFLHTWATNEFKAWHTESVKVNELCTIKNITNRTESNIEYLNLIRSNKSESSYDSLQKFSEKYDNRLVTIEIENEKSYHDGFKQSRGFGLISPLWYSWYKSVLLKSRHEHAAGFTYDYVIKLRPDIIFDSKAKLIDEINNITDNETLYAQGFFSYDHWFNDVFFISRSHVMDNASRFIVDTPDRHWYTNMPGEYFRSHNIKCSKTLLQLFSIYRPESIPKSSLNFADCFNIDHDYYHPASYTYRIKHE